MSAVGEKNRAAGGASVCRRTTELRIRQNEILVKFVEPKHRTIFAGPDRRQTLVARPGECTVIRWGELSRQCRIVSIGEVAAQGGGRSQMQCAGLSQTCNIWPAYRATRQGKGHTVAP